MTKGKIYTSMEPDMFGKGNKTIIKTDNGKSYKIQTTMEPDMFGHGNKQEIIETGNDDLYEWNGWKEELLTFFEMILLYGSLAGILILIMFLIAH